MSVRAVAPVSGSGRDPEIHPLAVTEGAFCAGRDSYVGPYALVQGEVRIGCGTRIEGHAVIHGPAEIEDGCRIYSYAVVGTDPQDQKYRGERTTVRVGSGATIREFVTVNRGTGLGGAETVVGSGCYLMAHVHVAHDCRLGKGVVIANDSTLAGHVQVGHHAVLGGRAAVGQHVRVGEGAFVAAGAMVERDVPPFSIAAGDRAWLRGPNLVGLRRLGVLFEARAAVTAAYALLARRDMTFAQAVAEIERTHGQVPEVRAILDFMATTRIGIIAPGGRAARSS